MPLDEEYKPQHFGLDHTPAGGLPGSRYIIEEITHEVAKYQRGLNIKTIGIIFTIIATLIAAGWGISSIVFFKKDIGDVTVKRVEVIEEIVREQKVLNKETAIKLNTIENSTTIIEKDVAAIVEKLQAPGWQDARKRRKNK